MNGCPTAATAAGPIRVVWPGVRVTPLVAVMLHLYGPAFAQVPRLTMTGLGAGMGCSEWGGTNESDERLEQWVLGFISAIAATAQLETGADPLARMDATSILAFLDSYCRQHPRDTLSVALIRLVFSNLP